MKLAIVASHPVQYNAPWYRQLGKDLELTVFYMYESRAQGTAKNEFGKSFEWDVDLLSGYEHVFLKNVSRQPGVNHYKGCDVPEIYKIIRRGNFDAVLVMGWYLKGYLQAALACRLSGVPVWVRGDSKLEKGQSGIKSMVKKLAFPLFLRLFNGFFYVGESNKAYLRHYGVSEKRMRFCPHFIDQQLFAKAIDAIEQQKLQNELGLKEATFKVLFVGKFIEKKRALDLLKAMTLLQSTERACEILLVGAGEKQDELKTYCHQHPEVTVHFLGFRNQTELPVIYILAHVLVLPSQGDETWGLVVNEAFAQHTPAVVSDEVGCYPDLIESGKTGEVFPMGEVEVLAQKIEKVLSYTGSEGSKEAISQKNEVYSIEHASSQLVKALSL